MAVADVFKTIKENEVKFVDLRFTDTKGKEQHVTVPVKSFDEDKFKDGHAFDGSSIAGWKGIEASDMLLMPDPESARMDPFFDEPTLNLTCDVLEPNTGKGYEREIGRKYLDDLNAAYTHFFFHYTASPLLVVNTIDIDFVNRREDFEDLIEKIGQTRAGMHYYVPLGSRK